MNSLLARVGIGAMNVDTVLDDIRVVPGGSLNGTVVLEGGGVRQRVEAIGLSLTTTFRRGGQPETVLLSRMRIGQGVTVRPGETQLLEFVMPVPAMTPLSMGEQSVVLRTRAALERAVDRVDQDALIVQPHPLLRRTFDELRTLGLVLRRVGQLRNRRVGWKVPYLQSFAFGTAAKCSWPFERLELLGFLHDEQLELWFELDRATAEMSIPEEDGPFAGRQVRLAVTKADLPRNDWGAMLEAALRSAPPR